MVERVESFTFQRVTEMNYLSQINIDTIRMAINDAINEYPQEDQIALRRISEKLRDNPSLYSLYHTEKDQISSAINDALFLLDDLTLDSDGDPIDLATYRDELERILVVLQNDSE
jgi:hypothetical protein